jgi:hypothetical protein
MKKMILLLSLLVCATTTGLAQPFSIDWFKIAGGGGTSTNAQFNLSGTIGQHDASPQMSGGNFALTSGYWALFAVRQTPGAPPLSINHSDNTVTVYWQDVSGWSLQQNSRVNAPGAWSASNGVTLSNGTNYLTLVSPPGNLFFRLAHP